MLKFSTKYKFQKKKIPHKKEIFFVERESKDSSMCPHKIVQS
jgi:hypothetical protein